MPTETEAKPTPDEVFKLFRDSDIPYILECYMDANNVAEVLSVLENIVREKAFHICENWQDLNLAADWLMAANRIYVLLEVMNHTKVPGIAGGI